MTKILIPVIMHVLQRHACLSVCLIFVCICMYVRVFVTHIILDPHLAVDLALSNGDFVSVALKHSQVRFSVVYMKQQQIPQQYPQIIFSLHERVHACESLLNNFLNSTHALFPSTYSYFRCKQSFFFSIESVTLRSRAGRRSRSRPISRRRGRR